MNSQTIQMTTYRAILVRDWEHFAQLVAVGEQDFFVGLRLGLASSYEVSSPRYSDKDGRLLGFEMFQGISSSWIYMTKKACLEQFPFGQSFYCRTNSKYRYRLTGIKRR
jgi:hypothetical protein